MNRTLPPKANPIESGFSFGEESLKNLEGVHPDLITLATRALEISAIDFGVHSGVRTTLQQETLIRQGLSKTQDSRHVPMPVMAGGNALGHAIDVHPVQKSMGGTTYYVFDGPAFDRMDEAFQKASLELSIPYGWGGRWRFNVDKHHFDLPASSYAKDAPKPEKKSADLGTSEPLRLVLEEEDVPENAKITVTSSEITVEEVTVDSEDLSE